jgi:hypothetical protein
VLSTGVVSVLMINSCAITEEASLGRQLAYVQLR